jgi:molybdopterin molybdotransferase
MTVWFNAGFVTTSGRTAQALRVLPVSSKVLSILKKSQEWFSMRSVPAFFNVQSVESALRALFAASHVEPCPVTIPTRDALGRVLAVAPRSPIDLPTFVRSTMDGYAVRAADTFGASQSLPAYLNCVGTVVMGVSPPITVGVGQAAEIYTGAMLPPGADAVVMVERTQTLGDGQIEVLVPVAPGENLVQIGEDVTQGKTILPAGHRLRPQDIGGLLAVGILSVEVAAPPRVAILSSGDELVQPEELPGPGQVRDINTYTLGALLQEAGAEVSLLGFARDSVDDLYAYARSGLDKADMLVMTAGSSVSTRDLTREVISGLGQPGILQHGLAVKPGKPTIIAVCDNKPVIGLPGNPVSALLVARQIVVPLVKRALSEKPTYPATIRATLRANIASATGRDDTIPVRLLEENGTIIAEPVFGKSNLIYTLVDASGLVYVPLNSNGLKAGTVVDVHPF